MDWRKRPARFLLLIAIGVIASPALAKEAGPGGDYIDQALALLLQARANKGIFSNSIAHALIKRGRCAEAIALANSATAISSSEADRLIETARAAGSRDCMIHFAMRKLGEAERHPRQRESLAMARGEVGAILRAAGAEAEGVALIEAAEAELRRKPITRMSKLWYLRSLALRHYKGTPLFAPELERTKTEFLASPPGIDRVIISMDFLSEHLRQSGDGEGARAVREAVCSVHKGTTRCGQSQSDEELAREGGGKIRGMGKGWEFGQTIKAAEERLAAGDFVAAADKARVAVEMRLTKDELALSFSGPMWDHFHARLARILAATSGEAQLAVILEQAAASERREDYFHAVAVGYAQAGNAAAARQYIARISDGEPRRRAWREIAETDRVPAAIRIAAAREYLAIPPPPKGSAGPHHDWLVECGELKNGNIVAAEGASLADIKALAELSRKLARPGREACAYRRYLLAAAKPTADERAKAIALELVSLATRPCIDEGCDDLALLRLLLRLGLHDKALELANQFDGADKIPALLILDEARNSPGAARDLR